MSELRIALLSLYSAARWTEYPIRDSLAAQRLAAYLADHEPGWTITLMSFEEASDPSEAISALTAADVDVVGLPAYMWTRQWAEDLASSLTEGTSSDRPLIVVGGPEVQSMDLDRWPDGVIFVMGQGELPLLELARRRARYPSYDGRSLVDDGLPVCSHTLPRSVTRCHATPSSDERRLPHGVELYGPRFADLQTTPPDEGFAWYETARGCIYNCSFCGHNTLPFFATFDLDFLERETKNMLASGIRRLFLIDPILGGRPSRGKAVLRAFQEHGPEISLHAYMRPEFLDAEFIDLLAESNIGELLVGLQTTNPEVPDHVRGNNFAKILKLMPQLSDRGIPWRAELIVGLPGDSIGGLRESLRFAIDELRPTAVHAYHLTAIPETKLFELLDRTDESEWIKADRRLRVVSSNSFDEAALIEMLRYAGAACSRYSATLERTGAPVSFGDVDVAVGALLRNPLDRATDATLCGLDHNGAVRLWKGLDQVAAHGA